MQVHTLYNCCTVVSDAGCTTPLSCLPAPSTSCIVKGPAVTLNPNVQKAAPTGKCIHQRPHWLRSHIRHLLLQPKSVPASSSTCTTGALSAGMYLKASQEAVVGRLATSMLSFTPKGMPYRGPLDSGCRLSIALQRSRQLWAFEMHSGQLCLCVAWLFKGWGVSLSRDPLTAEPDFCVQPGW